MKYAAAFFLLFAGTGLAAAGETDYGHYRGSTVTVTLLDVPFSRVEAVIGTNSTLFFKDVAVNKELKEVSADLSAVTVVLKEGSEPYTTLNLYSAGESIYGWLVPAEVAIVVRNRKDLQIWQKYLAKLKKEDAEYRREMFGPKRVLPPIGFQILQ